MNNKIAKLIRKQIKYKDKKKNKYEIINHPKKMYITKLDGTKEVVEITRQQITNPTKNAYRKIKKLYSTRRTKNEKK